MRSIECSSQGVLQDYRKEKEQSKETMALEVVTDGKMTKLKRMTRHMYTTREHGTAHMFYFVCRLLLY